MVERAAVIFEGIGMVRKGVAPAAGMFAVDVGVSALLLLLWFFMLAANRSSISCTTSFVILALAVEGVVPTLLGGLAAVLPEVLLVGAVT